MASTKTRYGKFELGVVYQVAPPIIVTHGCEKDVTYEMKDRYKLEGLLHIKEIFEKEEAPDYHALVWLSFASLYVAPSQIFGKIQIYLTNLCFPKETKNMKIEPLEEKYEQRELIKLKQWIFKKQIEHIKITIK